MKLFRFGSAAAASTALVNPADLGIGRQGRNVQNRTQGGPAAPQARGGRLAPTAPQGAPQARATEDASGLIELHQRLDGIEDGLAALGTDGRSQQQPQTPAPQAPASPQAPANDGRAPQAPAIVAPNATLDAAAMRAFANEIGINPDAGFIARNAGATRDQFVQRWVDAQVEQATGLNQIGGFGSANDIISERASRRAVMIRAAEATATGQRMPADLQAEFGNRLGPADLFRHICRSYGVRYPDDPAQYQAFYSQLRTVAPHVLADFESVANAVMGVRLISQLDEIQFAASEFTAYVGMNGYFANTLATPAVYDPLKPLTPGGEIEAGGITIFDLQARIETGARRYSVDRKLYVTNPIGMFNDTPRKVAIAGRTYQNVLHRDKLRTNPRMTDKIPFWNEVRGNVIGNAGLTPQGVALAQAKLTTDDLPIRGTILIVHPDDQFAADQIVAQNNPATYNQVNPYSGRLKVVLFAGVEPGSFILAIDPTIRPFLLDLGMDSMPEPTIELVPTAQYDGFEIKVVWDKGSAYGDPRGAVLAFPGAIPETLEDGTPSLYLAEDALLAA